MCVEFTVRSSKEIVFGCGTMAAVGEYAARLGRRALVVCGSRGIRKTGAFAALCETIEQAGLFCSVFDRVEPEPLLATVEAGRKLLGEVGADLVIAVGGGSAIDVGKAVAALGITNRPVADFFAGMEVPGRGLPCIALPTTSGTGAEVTPNSVFTDPATGVKASIRVLGLLPEAAVVDPQLTVSLPPVQTAHSGLDALVQAIEAFTSTGANIISDQWAVQACEYIGKSLPAAVADGRDLAARSDMALGSLLAGLALASARLGLVHGLAHPLGVHYHLPHGQVCGMLLPHVMRYNIDHAKEKYALLARQMGVGDSAEDLLNHVLKLLDELGVSPDFSAHGPLPEDLKPIIEATVASGSSRCNPRPVTADGVRTLLQQL